MNKDKPGQIRRWSVTDVEPGQIRQWVSYPGSEDPDDEEPTFVVLGRVGGETHDGVWWQFLWKGEICTTREVSIKLQSEVVSD